MVSSSARALIQTAVASAARHSRAERHEQALEITLNSLCDTVTLSQHGSLNLINNQ